MSGQSAKKKPTIADFGGTIEDLIVEVVRSGPYGDNCVGATIRPAGVMVVDTEDLSRQLFFRPDEWRYFIAGVKEGAFDLPE